MSNALNPKSFSFKLDGNQAERVLRLAQAMRSDYFASLAGRSTQRVSAAAQRCTQWVASLFECGTSRPA